MNKKVPIALLSCFLIAFILQGILKINGIFVFEKSLGWEIFKIIDNTEWLNIIFCIFTMLIIVYCLSFSITDKFYSKKWYHYLIMIASTTGVIFLRLKVTSLSYPIQILIDIFMYVLIPSIIYFTTPKANRLLGNDVYGIVVGIALHIMLYLTYLGLTYWSGLLSSFIFIAPEYANSVSIFLVKLEVYFALISFMLSTNMIVEDVKRRVLNMQLPIDIAKEEAKLKAQISRISNKRNKYLKKENNCNEEISKYEKKLQELEQKN